MHEELLQHLLGQTNGSAMQCEQTAAAVRQRLMVAEALPAGSVTTAAAVQSSGGTALRSVGGQLPK